MVEEWRFTKALAINKVPLNKFTSFTVVLYHFNLAALYNKKIRGRISGLEEDFILLEFDETGAVFF